MRRLPQSTSRVVTLKVFLTSDHVSAATGKTVAITISKNGATSFSNPAAGATNATEMASGWYKVTLGTGDTDTLGDLVVRGTATACDDSEQICDVVAATNGGLTALPAVAAEAAGGLYTRGTGAGQINQPANGMADVNLVRWLGTAASTPTVAGVPNVNAKTWNDLTTVALPLVPTTAGRTLDVSATGEAGLDWANVGSPTTVVGLSGTTVKTATDIATLIGAAGAGLTVLATQASVNTIDDFLDTEIAGIITTLGAAGAGLTALASAANLATLTAFVDTEVAAILAAVDTEVAAILADTNELQTDWVDGGRLDLILDARASQTSVDDLPTNAELTTALGTADDAVLAQIALVKAKTDNLPSDPADESLIIAATDALATLIGDVPTNAELTTALGTADDAILAQVALVPAALLDLADAIEVGLTLRQFLRLVGSAQGGILSGAGTATEVFKNAVANSKTRITATVDASGNRSAVVLDLT